MLKDAALLQLDLNRRALRGGPDAQGRLARTTCSGGARRRCSSTSGRSSACAPDEPWAGYRQFCMLFLYPLMLQAYKDLPYHALLRGSLDGIPPSHARAVLSSSGDRFRKGVLANVVMHARLEDRYADVVRARGQAADAPGGLQQGAARRDAWPSWRRSCAGLEWRRARRRGRATARTTATTPRRRQRKAAFVREAAGRRRCRADLGRRLQRRHVRAPRRRGGRRRRRARRRPRDGRRALPPPARGAAHGHPAARHVRHRPVARPRLARAGAGLARAARHAGARRSSSPSSTTCASRATSRCASCSDWVRSLDAVVVIEFPDRADPMVQKLLGGKRDGANPDYEAAAVRARARGALRRRAQRGGVADAHALRGAPAGVTAGPRRRLLARRPAPRRAVGARLRPAAVRPARAQRAVLRGARTARARDILLLALGYAFVPPLRRRGARVGARAASGRRWAGRARSRSSACSSAALVLPPLGRRARRLGRRGRRGGRARRGRRRAVRARGARARRS